MNKNIAFALALGFAVTTLVTTANQAEARRWGINARENRQQNRIYNGVSNGSLNQREASRLARQQQKLAMREARMRQSGGGLSPTERAKLQHEENRTSQNIYNQKHDGQTR
ncbi:MAG: hypothetical protein U0103_18740 [Candidatus Obscuribacterales bacterium]|nr:hypothetical protein [Cyanobacteria bacterium SZAS LIN-5]